MEGVVGEEKVGRDLADGLECGVDLRRAFDRDEEVDVDVDRRSWLAVVGEGEGAADRVGDLGRVEGAMDGYDLLRTFHRGHPYQCRPS